MVGRSLAPILYEKSDSACVEVDTWGFARCAYPRFAIGSSTMHSRRWPVPDAGRPPRLDAGPVNFLIKCLIKALCRIDGAGLDGFPESGPGIFVMNHINFLEAPMLGVLSYPRRVAGLTKKQNLRVPVYGYLAKIWNAIPLDRSSVDTDSFAACSAWLRKGGILGLTPEGTRSGDGVLRRGKAGVAVLAYRAGVPIWPVALWGGESFWDNLKWLRRTKVTIRVGKPFAIDESLQLTKAARQEVADEIMGRIAALMPERYRGPYADTWNAPAVHLVDWKG